MDKVMVGLSGGVDSSVAALLLQQQGYEVEAMFMKNWEEDDRQGYCSAARDLEDARRVAGTLGIRLRTVNFSSEYWDRVFTLFLEEYRAGRTPNPDVLCNQEIKFRAFLDHALSLGASRIATGHYAGVTHGSGPVRLLRGVDENKDQSYFLYRLNQPQLRHALFPLAELRKAQVRDLAGDAGLATRDKRDSTGICFIGERPFKEFLQRYLPATPGEIQNPLGEVLGRHDGLMYYTFGQRRGLDIGGRRDATGDPWYVVDKDLDHNVLVVDQGHDNPRLFASGLRAESVTWIRHAPRGTPFTCKARSRHRQPLQDCRLLALGPGTCRVRFDSPQRALTPGQSVVFYQDRECLGGGIIAAIER